ncbi:MAG: hypothetical protein NUV70_00405 [Caldiserica bacterium]|jgi:hypothetical protein|nr:hypothetical protein [Caldisericota bacterium]
MILRLFLRSSWQREYFYALLHKHRITHGFKSWRKNERDSPQAEAELDGRILPGQNLESFKGELWKIIGSDYEFEPIMVYGGMIQIVLWSR